MKKLMTIAIAGLMATALSAQAETAEEMVASMKKADMTYRELMAVMGKSSTSIHEGILRQNKQMVETGVTFILTHPAPNHKPWSIMAKEDQSGFKQTLMAYDKVLDQHANAILSASNKGDWAAATAASHELMNACASCHAAWKNKAK